VGSSLAGLLPTVIILAVYYTLCDVILIFQIYIYRRRNGITARQTPLIVSNASEHPTERLPLLDHIHESNIQEKPFSRKVCVRYLAAVFFICAAGIVAWWINDGASREETEPRHRTKRSDMTIQLIGWTSALLYIVARIPQILKNLETRCEGLSPALFLFSILGNITYVLSICAASMERSYLITNASWLAGSTLTIFLDVIVLVQFFYYRSVDRVQSIPVS